VFAQNCLVVLGVLHHRPVLLLFIALPIKRPSRLFSLCCSVRGAPLPLPDDIGCSCEFTPLTRKEEGGEKNIREMKLFKKYLPYFTLVSLPPIHS